MDSKSIPFASLFASSKVYPILEELSAFEADSREDDRGQRLFGKSENDQTYGFMFLQLLLESITIWAQTYPHDATKKPSRFKTHYDTLKAAGIKFPDVFMFYQGTKASPVSTMHQPGTPSGSHHGKEFAKGNSARSKGSNDDLLEELKDQILVTNLSLTESFEDLPWESFLFLLFSFQ